MDQAEFDMPQEPHPFACWCKICEAEITAAARKTRFVPIEWREAWIIRSQEAARGLVVGSGPEKETYDK